MYTAKLTSANTIQFYKDKIPFGNPDTENGFSSLEQVQKYCKEKIAHLSEQDAINSFNANPPIGDVDLSLPVITQEEKNKRYLAEKRAILLEALSNVSTTLLSQTAFDQFAAVVKADLVNKNIDIIPQAIAAQTIDEPII